MRKLRIALAIIAIAACAFLFQRNVLVIINWINTLGLFAPLFFLILYALATLLFLPTMVLTLTGGALFGPIIGTIFNLLGATIGATCAFCISRYMVCDWLAAKKNVRINKLIAGVERRGWQFVALLRLVPIIPFNIVNYGLGATRIKFSHYLIATAIFLLPIEFIVTYCGYAGMDILTHPQACYKSTSLIFLIVVGILMVAYLLLKRHRSNLKQKIKKMKPSSKRTSIDNKCQTNLTKG